VIEIRTLIEMLDERIAGALPSTWAAGLQVRSAGVDDHLPRGGMLPTSSGSLATSRSPVLVEWLNEALSQYADGVGEPAHEPSGGLMTMRGRAARSIRARASARS
jgi:hypothetical protein